jgi:hypothetical protein
MLAVRHRPRGAFRCAPIYENKADHKVTNFRFTVSDGGGERAAITSSIIASAKANSHEPVACRRVPLELSAACRRLKPAPSASPPNLVLNAEGIRRPVKATRAAPVGCPSHLRRQQRALAGRLR